MRLPLLLILALALLYWFRPQTDETTAITPAGPSMVPSRIAVAAGLPWWTPDAAAQVDSSVAPQPERTRHTRQLDLQAIRPIDYRDTLIFHKKLALARERTALADQTLAVALSFLGTPYMTGTLNQPAANAEQLVINLRQLDCWTFVESSLAIALAARSPEPGFTEFEHYVQDLRYWGSTIDGYSSRVHYFSAWLMQTEQLGYLQNLTQELGGIPYQKKIGYMSARPAKYPALKNPQTMQDLRTMEKRLNQQQWYFIPKARVAQMEHLLRDGDIIALTSWKRDLDIAHQGFAVKKKGRIYLLHASSLGRRVVLTAQPLAQYLATQKGQTGIMVARLVE